MIQRELVIAGQRSSALQYFATNHQINQKCACQYYLCSSSSPYYFPQFNVSEEQNPLEVGLRSNYLQMSSSLRHSFTTQYNYLILFQTIYVISLHFDLVAVVVMYDHYEYQGIEDGQVQNISCHGINYSLSLLWACGSVAHNNYVE